MTTLRTLWAPRMEIYGLEFSEVREAIGAGGGVLIADEQLQSESAHIDRRYYARPGIL
ncbi:MAG TPA: hypothetical protein VFW06_03255 [Acidimicrobiia bacterium]|nr:hypothetical protein [Acidimicrobiia bacterium]